MQKLDSNTHKNSIITVNDLTVAYKEKPVLWDIDIEIPKGILLSVVGPNGAGKTTLIKLITKIYNIEAGEILFDNNSINEYDL